MWNLLRKQPFSPHSSALCREKKKNVLHQIRSFPKKTSCIFLSYPLFPQFPSYNNDPNFSVRVIRLTWLVVSTFFIVLPQAAKWAVCQTAENFVFRWQRKPSLNILCTFNVHSSSDMEIRNAATNDLVPLTNAHLDGKWPETERKCNFGCQCNKKWILLVLYRGYNQLYLLLAQFSYTVTY